MYETGLPPMEPRAGGGCWPFRGLSERQRHAIHSRVLRLIDRLEQVSEISLRIGGRPQTAEFVAWLRALRDEVGLDMATMLGRMPRHLNRREVLRVEAMVERVYRTTEMAHRIGAARAREMLGRG